MSHFTVLVIGEDYEGQLAPYDENIKVAPYRDYADESDLKWYAKLYREAHAGEDAPTRNELAKFMSEHWEEEGEKMGVDRKGLYRLSTYNPDSMWDWYQVGGRWAGFFKAKQGVAIGASQKGRSGLMGAEQGNDADVIFKRDVDVDGMRDEAGRQAAKRYDLAASLLKGLPPARPWTMFYDEARQAVAAMPEGTDDAVIRNRWDEARSSYREQPAVQALDKHRKENSESILYWDNSPEDFAMARVAYIQRYRDRALATYAYVKDGEWFAPGRMGWWGMSSEGDDEKERFVLAFNEMFDALPDDTLLTLVDCHI